MDQSMMSSSMGGLNGSSSPRRKHAGKLQIKEEIPKDNIKRNKPTISPEKVYKHNFIYLPKDLKNRYNFVSLNNYMSKEYAHNHRLTMPTLCPNKDQKVYKLRLRLSAPFDSSYQICVIGSLPELGNFQE